MKPVSVAVLAGMIGYALIRQVAPADAAKFTESVLYSFCSQRNCTDGADPGDLLNMNGILYGTSSGGGSGIGCGEKPGCGTVFSLDPDTAAEKVVFSFCNQGNCADGAGPRNGLIAANGLLYGITGGGGPANQAECGGGCGTVFSLDVKTHAERVLHAFCSRSGCADGKYPDASLIDMNGTLYGETNLGGTNAGCDSGCGTVFSLEPAGRETVLHTFCGGPCWSEYYPLGGLIDVDGTLYGTTYVGGPPNNGGTVFAINSHTGSETVLYSFCSTENCADGRYAEGGVIDVNGTLYRTTYWGGGKLGCQFRDGCGEVFSVDPGTGAEKVVYPFCSQDNCADGAYPESGLLAVNGKLYGTTTAGAGTGCGGYGCGAVFSFDPSTGTETVLYAFCSQANCTDGAYPASRLIAVKGNLYGTTASGGANGYGTVFELKKQR